jgi:uncharacterized protein (TIGR03118 family)
MNVKKYSFRVASFLLLTALGSSCKKNNNKPPTLNENYFQTNLVADVDGFGALRTDPTLVNAWGLTIAPTGSVWIAGNGSGMSAVYDTNGIPTLNPVGMPFQGVPNASAPTGVIFNPTHDFIIPASQKKAVFIFATENGAVEAWGGGDAVTTTVADHSDRNSVYKGIALGSVNGVNYLYATDFHNGKINVFDGNFNAVPSISVKDPNIPAGYGPFNIANLGGQLFVTYALRDFEAHDDSAGKGHGFVDVYSPDGSLTGRFASQGPLNSPWGLALVPDNGFGVPAHSILVGNQGDGRINAFDSVGHFLGALQSNGVPLTIDRLWALQFGNVVTGANPDKLYFTAGPVDEEHGLFGYLLLQQFAQVKD